MATIPNTLEGEIFRRKCRKDYGTYCQFANPGFYMTKFHRYLCDEVQTFLDTPTDKIFDILLLSVPPRHGKSFTVTETLPSWFLGRDPTANVIIASYESTFAEAFSRRNRDKFTTAVQQVWPNSKPNNNVQGVALWETELGGRCRAAGLKAGITGHGADLFIIDDPIKNKEQADSEIVISKLQDEMHPSVQSRIHPGGKLIVIQTRWVEGDAIGWIQANWDEYIYKTINLPYEYDAEAMEIGLCPLGRKLGESLVGAHLGDDESKLPQRIKNTNEMMLSRKNMIIRSDGLRTWNALYQGRPSAAQGNLYPRNAWGEFTRTNDLFKRAEYIQLSVDASFKDTEISDFVAIGVWVLIGRHVYLWKLINKRMSFTNTVAKIKELHREFPTIDEFVIEDKANGSAIIDVFRYETDIPPIVAVNPQGGKVARAKATSNFVSQGNVFIPNDFTEAENKEIEWDGKEAMNMTAREKFIKQHASFPFGAKDDMVDMQTQGITRIIKLIVGEIPMPHKKHERYIEWYEDMWQDYESLTDDNDRDAFVKYHGAPVEWQEGHPRYGER